MVTFPYEKRMSSYSSKVICGMFSQWFDDNGYRKQKSCNHLITTLLWVVMDSNHRSKKQQIYSLPHLATLETTQGGGR